MDKMTAPSGVQGTYRRERERGCDHAKALRQVVHAFSGGVPSRRAEIAAKVAHIQVEFDGPVPTATD